MKGENLMTDTQNIPLKKLVLCERNVRKTGADEDLGELIASIEAHGLLQSLVVRPAGRSKFAVVAGGRRLRALFALCETGKVKADMPINCVVIADDAAAVEVSLAENVIRAPMHPADQFEAFRAVIEGNASTADVAARFGVSEELVAKRLKLGRLSPVILAAYRSEEIGLEEAQAFALSDDHAEQERLFSDLTGYARSARNIRQALTQSEVPMTDKRARFVGIEAYEAAGGTIRRDLFQDVRSGYLQDASLLDRLVMEKLHTAAEAVREEGWKRVDVMPDADYSVLSAFTRLSPERVPFSKKAKKELTRLEKLYSQIGENAEEGDQDVDDRLADIERQIKEIKATAERWPAKALAKAGVVISIDCDGSFEIRRGLVHPDDVRKTKKKAKAKAKSANGAGHEGSSLSAALVLDLTAHKTAAIRAELATRPDVALAGIVHALAFSVFYDKFFNPSSIRVRGSSAGLESSIGQAEGVRALIAMGDEHSRWLERLPGNTDALFAWCLEQSAETLLQLLAFTVASTVDARQGKNFVAGVSHHADELANALKLDMTAWYTPTVENYFGRISRKDILASIAEARGAEQGPGLEKLNKADLALRATRAIEGTGWLPLPLRVANDVQREAESLPQAAE
jgi:ParB family transcriptional regulator, chromosome partitioning protein